MDGEFDCQGGEFDCQPLVEEISTNWHPTLRFPKMNFLRGCFTPKSIFSEYELDKLCVESSMDRDEVERQYQQFLSHHKNGKMTRRDFQNLLRQSCPSMSDGNIKKLSQDILRMYDTTQDGIVDFREFFITLNIMKEGSPEENLKKIFRMFDINSDGVISLKELGKTVKDFGELMEKNKRKDILARTAFDEMDADKDGKIDQDEFVTACLTNGSASTSIALEIVKLFVN